MMTARDQVISVLGAALGIIPLILLGCSGSGTRPNPGSTVAVSFGGTGGSVPGGIPSGGSSLGVAGAGGATVTNDMAGASSVEGKTGGAISTVATPSSSGGGGTSGTSSALAGSRTGGTTLVTAGASSAGGTLALAGSTAAGGSSSGTATSETANSGGSSGGTSASGGTTSGSTRSSPTFPPRFVGNIDTRGKVLPDFYKYWDQFSPENAGKWPSVQGTGAQYTFKWDVLDAMYAYTEENKIVFKEAWFLAGGVPPAWLTKDNAVESANIWMKAFCERYPNTRLIDVVKEPLHGPPSVFTLGLGGGNGTTWEWVANAFRIARAACPHAVLILSDYGICEYQSDHQKFLDLMSAIQKLDAPLDAIGCEGHDAAKVPVSKFKGYLDALASQTGLPIYITEFDIGLSDDEQQRQQYADYFTMFWDNPNVKGATVWGYIVGTTWRNYTGIMSSDGTMRPAMSWLMDFLKR